jgi:hypothetical protein
MKKTVALVIILTLTFSSFAWAKHPAPTQPISNDTLTYTPVATTNVFQPPQQPKVKWDKGIMAIVFLDESGKRVTVYATNHGDLFPTKTVARVQENTTEKKYSIEYQLPGEDTWTPITNDMLSTERPTEAETNLLPMETGVVSMADPTDDEGKRKIECAYIYNPNTEQMIVVVPDVVIDTWPKTVRRVALITGISVPITVGVVWVFMMLVANH